MAVSVYLKRKYQDYQYSAWVRLDLNYVNTKKSVVHTMFLFSVTGRNSQFTYYVYTSAISMVNNKCHLCSKSLFLHNSKPYAVKVY